jgi:hypothetical protein
VEGRRIQSMMREGQLPGWGLERQLTGGVGSEDGEATKTVVVRKVRLGATGDTVRERSRWHHDL